ncbi:MAG: HDOD domain-containing protein [Gammaproteobacteria bacterium]|nr:MAG: HDOD domain-containing protein [Gammaproteobacteria bacterium]
MSLEQQFTQELLEAIENDQLVLPTLPEVALQIQDAVNDPEVSANKLAEVIGQDAAMAASIIKVANSPLLRGRVVVDNLQLAITRLGITFVRNLALGLAMEQMFQATTDVVDRLLRKSWEHSVEVAAICQVLASRHPRLKVDQATLAGLTHQIGVLPILTLAEETPELLENEDVLEEIIEKLHPQIGTAILKSWDFSEELAIVPSAYLDFGRDSQDGPDYGDLVTVANLQSLIGTNHPLTQLDWSTIPAFEKLGISPDIEVTEMEDFKENLEEARQIFI